MPLSRRSFLVAAAAGASTAAKATRGVAEVRPSLESRLAGSLWAMAIGDGMGAPVEGWEGARIRETFGNHDFTTFLPPTDPKLIGTGLGKGNGHITDDLLLVEAMIHGYAAHRDHLDAHAYARHVIAPLAERRVWVPEKQAEMTALERPVWWPERYAYHALVINNADPRTAGQGNWPQQGLMGIVMPTGAINAGDPRGAYDEVVAFGVAHQHSFALEAAAITAAAFAAAFAGDGSLPPIIAAARALAKDGTAEALGAVLATVDPADDYPTFEAKARKAYTPYFGLPPSRLAEELPATNAIAGTNVGGPSRIAAVENLTAGFAALLHGDGDFLRTLKASLFYGQDCESIAAFALGLLAGAKGRDIIPRPLVDMSKAANRRDYDRTGAELASIARDVAARDADRLMQRRRALR
jgi:ADP-ribosylglycohydrolase